MAKHTTVTGRPFRIHRNSGLLARTESPVSVSGAVGGHADGDDLSGQLQSVQAHPASTAPVETGMAAQGFWLGPDGVPRLNMTTKETKKAFRSSRMFQRLRHAKWLRPLSDSRDALYPWSRILAVQQRMEAGDLPPLLPSEVKELARRQRQGWDIDRFTIARIEGGSRWVGDFEVVELAKALRTTLVRLYGLK